MEPFYHAVQQPIVQLSLFDFSNSDTSTKVCRGCGVQKSVEDFAKEKSYPDGRRATCRKCINEQRREHRLHPAVKPIPRPGYKFCTECDAEKLLEEFHVHKHGFGGREPKCKVCKAAYDKTTKSTPEHQEREKIRHRKNQKYYAAHYIKAREAYQERGRAWRKANPDKQRESNLRRKSHKLNTVVETVDYKAILERDGYHCYLCGKPIDPTAKSRTSAALTFDHKVPLQPRPGEPQGTHTADNIFPAHHACNTRKQNIPFELLTPWQRRGV